MAPMPAVAVIAAARSPTAMAPITAVAVAAAPAAMVTAAAVAAVINLDGVTGYLVLQTGRGGWDGRGLRGKA